MSSGRRHNDPIDPGPVVREHIARSFFLCAETGRVWSRRSRRFIGTKSNGCAIHDGYARIVIRHPDTGRNVFLKFHHVVFFLYRGRWPRLQIDHPGDKTDHRPHLLEEVTDAENQRRRNEALKRRRARFYEERALATGYDFEQGEKSWTPRQFRRAG